MIGGATGLYGVVGWPVAHSLSPAMQNAALAAAGIDAAYLALPVAPARLDEALRGAHALGLLGLNVTLPHKAAAAAACAELDPIARAVGAANTLRRAAAGWSGFNTDASALLELLREAGLRAGDRVLLAGAGGAARAGAWAALRLGCRLRVAARRPEPAAELCRSIAAAVAADPGRDPAAPAPEARPVPWEALADEARDAAAVVNGTSVGLPGAAPALPGLRFRARQVALDMVYGDTAFAREAAAAGARVVRGEALLLRQGEHAFTLWTGLPAPAAAMAGALEAARPRSRS